ncbi:hypothetical protein QBC45DRAFT_20400 [Copromyces sp. CBS 386.78]|nr:hypothetical protein QBC45DRAFT_20400 [Copromyces sp. CBS 386.78]
MSRFNWTPSLPSMSLNMPLIHNILVVAALVATAISVVMMPQALVSLVKAAKCSSLLDSPIASQTPAASSGEERIIHKTAHETASWLSSVSALEAVLYGIAFLFVNCLIGLDQFVNNEAEWLFATLGGYHLETKTRTERIRVLKTFIEVACWKSLFGPVSTAVYGIYTLSHVVVYPPHRDLSSTTTMRFSIPETQFYPPTTTRPPPRTQTKLVGNHHKQGEFRLHPRRQDPHKSPELTRP